MKHKKEFWPTIIITFLAGCLGLHRFYLGQWGYGLLYLFTLGFLGVLPLIDLIVFLFRGEEDFNFRYNNHP